MSETTPGPVCLSCSVFQREIEALRASGRIDMPVRFLGSMLHMAPDRLQVRVEAAMDEERARGGLPILAYGDCCPRMVDLDSQAGVARTRGLNCCEVILGRERYRSLRKEGVFFVMPEWALRWREVFQSELGLSGEVASSFMRDMHTRLLYVDTGLMPVPETHLAELSAFTGLPWEGAAGHPGRAGREPVGGCPPRRGPLAASILAGLGRGRRAVPGDGLPG